MHQVYMPQLKPNVVDRVSVGLRNPGNVEIPCVTSGSWLRPLMLGFIWKKVLARSLSLT